MLARANRVTRPGDFRTTLRRGRRVGMPSTVLHINDRAVDEPSRFGFIVTKSVGNAVTRNLVRRRLRAASRELLPAIGAGKDIVIRALPGSDRAGWATLHTELAEALEREGMRG